MSEPMFDVEGKRVWVAGHAGLVGAALVKRLQREPIADLITARSREVDLRRQTVTEDFLQKTRPDVVLLAAARAGGIHANRSAQAQFLYDNLMIAANVVEASRRAGVERLVVLGSSCIYPREAAQPIAEAALMTGPLEPTNEGYAVAKIVGLELAKFYRQQYELDAISLMPTNLYGPNDNFDLATSHVLPALLRKVHEAREAADREVVLWGSGRPRREFLHVDDLAEATIFCLRHYDDARHLNVGTGRDVTIRELAELIADIVGWSGEFVYDTTMPDGVPRKLLDTSRITQLGWSPKIGLREGITSTYEWFLENVAAPT